MAQSKTIEQFTDAGAAAAADQLLLNQKTSNTTYAVTNITVAELFSNVPSGVVASVDKLVIRQSSNSAVPSTSNTAATPGTIWYDSDFIYIAVSNTVVMRATLSTF